VLEDADVVLLEDMLEESVDVSGVLVEDVDKELEDSLVDDVDSELKDEEVLMVEESVDVVVKDTVLLLNGVDVEPETEPEEVVVALMEEGNDEPLTEEDDELVGSTLDVVESPA
jgi:hypothetical protein